MAGLESAIWRMRCFMSDDRLKRGSDLVSQIYGNIGAEFLAQVREVAPDLPRYVREFAFGDIYSRSGLDPKTRELIIISALATQGDTEHEIRAHAHGAMNLGVSREELVETVMQLAPYAGFPRTISAMRVIAGVFTERDEAQKTEG